MSCLEQPLVSTVWVPEQSDRNWNIETSALNQECEHLTLQVASEIIRGKDSQSIIFHADTYWTNITPIDLETPQ